MKNDSVMIAYYTGGNNTPREIPFNFNNLPFGSPERVARCAEYDAILGVLKDQGCDVHVWDAHYWPRYRDDFRAGKLLRSL